MYAILSVMSTNKKRITIVLLFVVLVALYVLFDVNRYVSLENFQQIRGDLNDLFEGNPILFVAAFFLFYAVVVASSLPLAGVTSLAGGALLGTMLATIIIVPAATLGSILPYLASKYVIKDYVQNKFSKVLKKVNAGIEDSGWWYLLSARLSAIVPFVALNLVSGVSNISLRSFVSGTFLGIIPGTIVYTYAGSQIGASTEAGTILRPGVLIALLLLALVPLIVRYLQKKLLKKVSKTHGEV